MIKAFEIDKRSDYSIVDVLYALYLLYEKPMGRFSLMNELGLNEASIKTLLKRMKSYGLVEKTTKGHALTGIGKNIAGALRKKITLIYPYRHEIFDGKNIVLAVVKKACKKVKTGIEQRDAAMRYDSFIVTLIFNKKVKFPDTDKVVKGFDDVVLENNDVLLLSNAKNRCDMIKGVFSAFLTLI